MKDYSKYFKKRSDAYLNSASSGICTLNAFEAAHKYLETSVSKGNIELSEYFEIVADARRMAAETAGAKEKNIGLTTNTTHGVLLIKNAFPEIRNAVIFGRGFPCTTVPFLHDKRYRVEVISDSPDTLEKTLAEFGRSLVFVDLIHFLTGRRADIERISEIVRKHNGVLAVDAIQAAGSVPIDAEGMGCDFLFTGTSKWLLGPEGCGFIYIKDEHIEKTVERNLGWLSLDYKDFGVFEHLPGPRRDASGIEGGTRNVIGLIIMKENLRVLNSEGISEIFAHNLEGAARIAEIALHYGTITQDADKLQSSTVSLKCRNVNSLHAELTRHGVITSLRDGHIRAAFHLYNDENDIEKFGEVMKRFAH